jgi:hypothetical protein
VVPCATRDGCRVQIFRRRTQVQRKNDQDNSSLPGCGIFVLALLAALILGGLWGGTEIYRRANLSERHAALFASEGISTAARVVRVQRRGGGNDRRSTLHYRYVGGDREYAGATTVRRAIAIATNLALKSWFDISTGCGDSHEGRKKTARPGHLLARALRMDAAEWWKTSGAIQPWQEATARRWSDDSDCVRPRSAVTAQQVPFVTCRCE